MAQLRPPIPMANNNNNAEDADAEEKYDEYNQDVANDSEIEDAKMTENLLYDQMASWNHVPGEAGRRPAHKHITIPIPK